MKTNEEILIKRVTDLEAEVKELRALLQKKEDKPLPRENNPNRRNFLGCVD